MARNGFESGFLDEVRTALRSRDFLSLLQILKQNWPAQHLVDLLASEDSEVAAAAATCLGMAGSMEHCAPLAALLTHDDDSVVSAAEDALWSIWMLAGSDAGNQQLANAIRAIQVDDFETALQTVCTLAAAEPGFAEAYHQLAIALHSQQRLDEAELAYQQALELNSFHFAAACGLGHIHLEREELGAALEAYRRALQLNPRLPEIPDLVNDLERVLHRRVVA